MTMWMVRAESDGSLFQPFIDQGLVAIGWSDVGDLGQFESREALVAELRERYPGKRAGWRGYAAPFLEEVRGRVPRCQLRSRETCLYGWHHTRRLQV